MQFSYIIPDINDLVCKLIFSGICKAAVYEMFTRQRKVVK